MMQEVDLCGSLTDELDIRTTIIQNTSEPQNKPFVPKVLLGRNGGFLFTCHSMNPNFFTKI